MKYRLQRLTILFLIITLLLASLLPNSQSEVLAQIDNNQPNQAYASIVDCIRSGADLGFDPDVSPRFVTSCYRTKITSGGYTARSDAFDAYPSDSSVISFGDAKVDGVDDLANNLLHTTEATIGDVGSIYGLAFSSGTNPLAPAATQAPRIFAGAHNKMQTRFGAGGPGGIYQINRQSGMVSLYVTVPNVVPGPLGQQYEPGDGSATVFPNTGHEPNYTHESGGLHVQNADSLARDLAGKASLGDVTLDPQERYLYTVNLNNKRVYRFDTWSSNPQSTMTILPAHPALSNPSACNQTGNSGPQDLRPFALNVTNSSLYLGFVCSAESSQNRQDLAAGVMRFDLTTNAWAAHATAFGLTDFDTQRGTDRLWQPWRNGTTPSLFFSTPLLSDIEFDENRNMILGFRDRSGDMNSQAPFSLPLRAEGDLLYLELNTATSTWGAPSSTTEHFIDTSGVNSHIEAAGGGIAYLPGNHDGSFGGEVVSTFVDPYRNESFGAAWWDVSGGSWTAREELYQGGLASHLFGKASGLGDIELLCSWASIGDRVWRDTNGNGIQDAGESDISGVRLQIFLASDTSYTNPLGTVTTGSVADMSGNWRFYVNPFETYHVRIDPAMFTTGQPLAGLRPTLANATHDAQDSDANAAGVIVVPPIGDAQVDMTFDFGLTTQANVRIAKTGTANVLVGNTINYTLAYVNDGPSNAASVSIIDTLPPGVSFVSSSPAPTSVVGQVLTWNVGTLAANATGSITINATATSNAATQVTNAVTITTTTSETTTSDNSDTHTTQILRPDVYVTKSGTPTAPVGSTVNYTLSYGNSGTGSAANTTIVDTLPAGVHFVSSSPAPTSVAGQVLTWNVGTLAANATGTITVNTQSSATLANGATVINSVQISTTSQGDDPGNNSSSTTTIMQRADVRISKSSPTVFPVLPGETVRYHLDFSNAGPATAVNVELLDTVPAQLHQVTWNCVSGCTGSGSGNTIVVPLGTLAAGTSGRIMVVAIAHTSLDREDILNIARISTTTPETDTRNNESSALGEVWTSDTQILKVAPATVIAGTTMTTTLRYANNGPAPAQSVVVSDTLPTGLVFESSIPAPNTVVGQVLTWDLGSLASGNLGVIELIVRVDSALRDGSTVTNTAHITTPTPDRDPSNNESSAQTYITNAANLGILKDGTASVGAGDLVSYTLIYTNAGPSVGWSTIITDILPVELVFVDAQPVPSVRSGNHLSWQVGDLAVGQGGVITVTARTATQLAISTIITNTVTIVGTPDDPDPDDNTATSTTAILKPDLTIMKDDGRTEVLPGDELTYTFVVRNTGLYTATNVVLTDTLPEGLAPVSSGWSIGTQNSYSQALGDLAPGDTITRTMRVVLPNPLPTSLITQIRNIVTVADDGSRGPDPTPGNNTDEDQDTPLVGRIGDTVWLDDNANGLQDGGEVGLAGIVVQLFDVAGREVARTITDAQGRYSFDGLRFGGYSVQLDPRTLLSGTYQGYQLSTPFEQPSILSRAIPNDLARDFGLYPRNPTAVDLSYFIVEGTRIRWGTVQERDTDHFEIIRSSSKTRTDGQVIGRIVSQGAKGGHYTFHDEQQPQTIPLYYWLVEVDSSRQRHYFGPVAIGVEQRVYLPLVAR